MLARIRVRVFFVFLGRVLVGESKRKRVGARSTIVYTLTDNITGSPPEYTSAIVIERDNIARANLVNRRFLSTYSVAQFL